MSFRPVSPVYHVSVGVRLVCFFDPLFAFCSYVLTWQEEEEQLLSAPKEESLASQEARRIAQEEEENLFLRKGPLLKKLAEIG